MHRHSIASALLVAAGLFASSSASAIVLPPDFVAEDIAPGAYFFLPVTVNFLPDGRQLVCEKGGVLWVVKDGVKVATPMWDGSNEVLSDFDRGLLDVAVDPNYFVNHYIYLLYTVDPDSDGVDDGDGFGRLTRYQVSFADSNTLVPSSRTILMGTWWPDAPPELSETHTIGTLRWGFDGSLFVGAGDGAEYVDVDSGGRNPEDFLPGMVDPLEDIGAFRSQYLGSLAGKILRINPATGHGYASNPYVNGNLASKQSRIWCYGLRNPFRFNVKPGSGVADTSAGNPGVLYIGDVGWGTWEEMDICDQAGQNFGWPCYEGIYDNPLYQAATPAHNGCDSIGIPPTNPAPARLPESDWNHSTPSVSLPPGFIGNTSIGGAFYQGQLYPGSYRGKYFFADYGQSWIKVANMDSVNHLISIQSFADSAAGPVCVRTDPTNGDIIYVSIESGEVRRIRYTGVAGGNTPPVAVANGAPLVGTAPLTVDFSSVGTYDPDGDPITYNWTFGDGFGSGALNPQHTYTVPGTFHAVLTVTDTAGAMGTSMVTVVVNSGSTIFPTTPVLDDFNRADGPIGGLWVDDMSALQISSDALVEPSGAATTVWNGGTFGADQEAYITLDQITPSGSEHDLMLKVQGTTWSAGHIEVRYNASAGDVVVSTYDPGQSWVTRGTIPVTFAPGDKFGARAYSNGTVEIYQNGAVVGTTSTGDWPSSANGGRLGLTIAGATSSRLDDFGGGTVQFNTAPTATILMPPDSSFYFAGDTVKMTSMGSDAQDPPDSLKYRWEVDLHHSAYVHADTLTADSSAFSMVTDDYDDGTGVWLLIRLIVTDKGALRDTAYAHIFPEVDLEPGAVVTTPGDPGTADPTTFQFKLYNHGRLPAPISHWSLIADGTLLAEGDTTLAALDTVTVTRIVPPTLAAGTYTLRVVADTLGAIVETDETNNTATRTLTVVSGSGTVDVPHAPLAFSLSGARPNPSAGSVGFALQLPRESRVGFDVVDLQGRRVWREAERRIGAGDWTLTWNRRTAGGGSAGPGLYFARITVDGSSYVRRFAIVR